MNFTEAFKAMKQGEKVKLPGWEDTGTGIRRRKPS